MVEIKGMAHVSIPVSDLAASTRFYTEIVGCRHLATTPNQALAFLDAGGDCIILVKHEPPINRKLDNHNGVHHSFKVDKADYAAALDHLRAHGIPILFEEDRPVGVVCGPRAYFRDPDGTVLEYIDLTSYAGAK
jgi:glyoxylase I family protein